MQKQFSRFYTGSKGTNHDIEGTLMPPEKFREKRNARLLGDTHSGVSSYCEGFTDLGKLPGVSDVVVLKFRMSGEPETNVSLSFNVNVDGTPHAFSMTYNYEDPDQAHRAISDEINTQLNGQNIFAASIGTSIFIWFDNQSANALSVTVTNVISSFRYSININSTQSDTVHPMAYWSSNKESIILSVIPTSEASDETTDVETTQTLCQLYKITYDDDGTEESIKLLYNNFLNYRLWKKPFIRGVVENGCIHRIYLTEGLNPFRSFNVNEPNLFAIAPDTTRITPSLVMSPPEIIKMTSGGFLPTGAIQYTYRIFGNNGSVSPVAPFSNMIYLPEGDLNKDSFQMTGGALQTLSGKSVEIRIDGVNVEYERIQIIALYREAESATTDSEIIYDAPIEKGEITITHSTKGDGLAISIEEIFEENKAWDKAEVIEVHENHLIAADLKSDFSSANNFDALIKQYDNTGQTYNSRFNPDPDTFKYLPNTLTNAAGTIPLRVHGGESDGWASGNGIRFVYEIDDYLVDAGKPYITPPLIDTWGQIGAPINSSFFGVNAKKQGVLQRSLEPNSQQNSLVTDLYFNNHYEGHTNPLMVQSLPVISKVKHIGLE